jgi:carboxylate-amine ligase
MTSHPYTFGIEEEYFLAQADGSLAAQIPERLIERARASVGEAVKSELLQSQIEIASPVYADMDEALRSMTSLRIALGEALLLDDLRLVAASTHPLGAWRDQWVTERRRYDRLLSDFRIVGERNLVCGMHVHVEVPPDVDRVQLMNRFMPWLPLFLALSTSSPFWDRRVTGLLSYRQAIYDEWPRSGVPDFFTDEADYQGFIELMQRAGAIADASYIWWAIRPALRYPTLELRIADICTHVEDSVALAALFRCLIAALVRDPHLAPPHTTRTRRLIDENRWRAKRDGVNASLIDERLATAVPVRDVLAHTLAILAEDAARLSCVGMMERLMTITVRGTSAQTQLRIYNECRAGGATQDEALRAVMQWLMDTTSQDHSRIRTPAREVGS